MNGIGTLSPILLESLIENASMGFYPAIDVESTVRQLLTESDGYLQYTLVFLLAAIPLIEILIVIPIGIALGLDPTLVTTVAVLGNALPVYALVLASKRVRTFVLRQRSPASPSKRRKRAKRIWKRYGLPGFALSAPITTGVHVGAIVAVGLGATRRSTIVWMTIGIVAWAIAIAILSVTGASIIRLFT